MFKFVQFIIFFCTFLSLWIRIGTAIMEQDPEQYDIDPDPLPQDCFLVGGGFISFYIGTKIKSERWGKKYTLQIVFSLFILY